MNERPVWHCLMVLTAINKILWTVWKFIRIYAGMRVRIHKTGTLWRYVVRTLLHRSLLTVSKWNEKESKRRYMRALFCMTDFHLCCFFFLWLFPCIMLNKASELWIFISLFFFWDECVYNEIILKSSNAYHFFFSFYSSSFIFFVCFSFSVSVSILLIYCVYIRC